VVDDKNVQARGVAREVKEEESRYKRDTLPPSPDKARIIESAITKEVLTRLDAVVQDEEVEETPVDIPSIPPPEVPSERIQEGVQYRIVQPASGLPPRREAAPARSPDATWEAALVMREHALRGLETELRQKEEWLLQREMVVGGKEKIVRQREERLNAREMRVRNWEARLLDREASLRERESGEEGGAEPARTGPEAEPAPSSREMRVGVAGGTGVWEIVEETDDGSKSGS